MAIEQTNLNFRLETPLGDNVLVVSSFRCHEAISQLPRCELELASDQLAIDFKTIIGKPVLLTLDRPGGSKRHFHGIVTSFAQRPPLGSHARYEAEVHPTLWVLTQRRNSRIFQEKTVPEIVKAILDEAAITKLDEKIAGKHPVRSYCVQYQETDFDFISRLMEEEGIFYWYRHDPEDGHTLVLCDGTEFDPVPGVAEAVFAPNAEEAAGREAVYRLRREQHLRTARYVVDDYNLFDPKTDLQAQAEATLPQELPAGTFEIFDYPSGQVKQGGEEEGKLAFAEDLVNLRVEAARAAASGCRADSDIHGLVTGHRLHIANTPRSDFDGDYLITGLQLEGDQSGSFETLAGGGEAEFTASLECQPLAEAPAYRPLLRTPRPRMAGPQTAVVVGPAGEEIHTDKLGRICLQFHWDRYGQYDDKSSCWVRVSQSWAGNLWGAFVLPRIGMEVVVDFLDGDPDRPLVTGAVYNAQNLPPYELPAGATQSVFKSQSSKGGGGGNELRFEDKKDAEQVWLHGQMDLDLQVEKDRRELVGHDRHLTVKNDRFERTEGNLHESIGADHRRQIIEDHHLEVQGKEAVYIGGSRSVEIGGEVNEEIAGNHNEKVDGNVYIDSSGDVVIEAANSITLVVGGNYCVVDNTGVTLKGSILTLDGSLTNINSGSGSSASSGNPGSLVPPAEPEAPVEPEPTPAGATVEAPKAHRKEPSVKQVAAGEAAAQEDSDDQKKDWVEIEMENEDGEPAAGERYEIKLPDGSVAAGTLDEKGHARVEGIDPGQCKVTFPDLDKKNWEKNG